jgi:hypothetical protein
MSSKSRPAAKKPQSAPKSNVKGALVGAAISTGKSLLGIGDGKKGKGGRRKHKKSAQFYAKEIMRLKLKKRYEKVKLGLYR